MHGIVAVIAIIMVCDGNLDVTRIIAGITMTALAGKFIRGVA